MDADTPDLVGLQKVCKKYDAFMMIDMAHDFGCMGASGKGNWEAQGLKDLSNVVLMGGGSKCLSTNLGWVGCTNKAVVEFMKVHCTAYMFTNAVNPVQCATALSQLRLLRSEEGNRIRKKVIENYMYTKKRLEDLGYKLLGQPSPILIVLIGDENVSRLVSRLMMDEGVHVNGIE
jgi:glycine C-acetyltransferase